MRPLLVAYLAPEASQASKSLQIKTTSPLNPGFCYEENAAAWTLLCLPGFASWMHAEG